MGNPETDRVSMGFSTTFLKDFHVGCCEVFETGCEVFGSGQEGGEDSVPEMGRPEVSPQAMSQDFPGFWGGARDADVSMLDSEGEDQVHEEVRSESAVSPGKSSKQVLCKFCFPSMGLGGKFHGGPTSVE